MPTFDLSEYDALKKYLDEGITEGVRRGLDSTAKRLVGVIQNEIIPAANPPPVFDGAYRASWKDEPTAGGHDVYSDAPYAGIIEYGVRAENVKIGRAMIDMLAEWARRKGLTGHAPHERSSPEARADARQIAWAIARSMQGTATKPGTGIFNRGGQQGLRIAEKAALRVRDFVGEEIAAEVDRRLG
jgi:hypothetical protein